MYCFVRSNVVIDCHMRHLEMICKILLFSAWFYLVAIPADATKPIGDKTNEGQNEKKNLGMNWRSPEALQAFVASGILSGLREKEALAFHLDFFIWKYWWSFYWLKPFFFTKKKCRSWVDLACMLTLDLITELRQHELHAQLRAYTLDNFV